ncbi:hypothetical protein ACSSOE_10910 [Intestinibacter bartlettii]|jgi:hypothetical protein|uniref:hypothetical protein n=1 Tax=Intestinibacter bartlettii TaxID=261299 RepID=UPI0011074526|nr:hypothetical protein [Intestinibacter bartlettii]DAS37037.1 MAG TPA: hypothetical protein [Caudoviricetes sp.]
MNKEEMESSAAMICTVLKGLLEETGLYIAVDKKTKEFVFIERESWDKGNGKGRTARVSMEQINVKE